MKYFDLDPEEKEIEQALEKGKFKSVKNFATGKRRLQKIARNTLLKTKNINIRLTEKVLVKLKAKAASEGIPYQTLVASILHRFTSA